MFKINYKQFSELRYFVNEIYVTNAGYNRKEVDKLNEILDEIEHSNITK